MKYMLVWTQAQATTGHDLHLLDILISNRRVAVACVSRAPGHAGSVAWFQESDALALGEKEGMLMVQGIAM